MSSFLQRSIELLNSYYFIKQKKCKRGLLKSKVLAHVWTVYFPSNFASNPYPPPLSEPARFNQRKGPTTRGGAQGPSSSPDVAPTAWLSGAGSERRFPTNSGSSRSVTGRNQQHRPAGIKSHAQLGVPTLTESGEPRFLPAESTNWLSDFSGRTEHLSPLLKPPPV